MKKDITDKEIAGIFKVNAIANARNEKYFFTVSSSLLIIKSIRIGDKSEIVKVLDSIK